MSDMSGIHITRIIRPVLLRGAGQRLRAAADAESSQLAQLRYLADVCRHTGYGRSHGAGRAMTYADFAGRMPLTDYEDLRPMVMRMIAGERDLLWPGRVRRYAQSSGTTGGKSKYVPITDESLRRLHYRGAAAALSFYLRLHPESRIFSGKSFILGGSFASELHPADSKVRIGDLSASLIECISPLAELVRVPSRRVALMADWETKLPALVSATLKADVTNISGVPSWFLTVLKAVTAAAGAGTIHDVWPHLEVFFHGGIAFGPYRDEYRAITDPARMHYVETYNASEGFFAAQDTGDPDAGMLLLTDCGLFYEFVPADSADTRPRPVWELERGRVYEMVITACNGLWRYRIGDTVRVTSTDPVRITVAGRTRSYINAFGEELMVYNADRALEQACSATGAMVADYTAAPVYARGRSHGHHQWLIEFDREPDDPARFARVLDEWLRRENSDYDAKRSKDIFLDGPEIVIARKNLFDDWLAATGRRGGQRKVPRLSNDRELIDSLLKMN